MRLSLDLCRVTFKKKVMRFRIGLLVMVVFSFCNCLSAQIPKEKTKEKEIVISGPGKIALETGEEVSGMVTHSKLQARRVSLKKEDGSSETYKITEVKWFMIDAAFFEKTLYPGPIKDQLFAGLLSNPTSPIKVYDISWQEPIAFGPDVDAGVWPTLREKYVYFPVVDKLKPFSDVTFIPFVKKVSKLVEDCPDVVSKINQKEKGYVITLLSTEEDKMNVFINIANLYGLCKEPK